MKSNNPQANARAKVVLEGLIVQTNTIMQKVNPEKYGDPDDLDMAGARMAISDIGQEIFDWAEEAPSSDSIRYIMLGMLLALKIGSVTNTGGPQVLTLHLIEDLALKMTVKEDNAANRN